ncbi:hypothetical protein RJ639_041161, partial [Escallonia herrerae]
VVQPRGLYSRVNFNTGRIRLMKYKASPLSNESIPGLVAYFDKSFMTILSQNEVQGLEILSKEGTWNQVTIPKGCFLVVIGETLKLCALILKLLLKVWSNVRLSATSHKVTLRGAKDRYSCGLFLSPKEGVSVEVPDELVDKDYLLRYKPFVHSDYISFCVATRNSINVDALELYAGV